MTERAAASAYDALQPAELKGSPYRPRRTRFWWNYYVRPVGRAFDRLFHPLPWRRLYYAVRGDLRRSRP